MATILVSFRPEPIFELGLVEALRAAGCWAARWDPSTPITDADVDAAVLHVEDLDCVARSLPGSPALVAISDDATPAVARSAFGSGAQALVQRTQQPETIVATVSFVATTPMSILPLGIVEELAARLEEPPSGLEETDLRFLQLTARMTIEAAGAKLGYSRRQAQRRFRTLCDSYGLADRLEAAVKATRWGLNGHADNLCGHPDGNSTGVP